MSLSSSPFQMKNARLGMLGAFLLVALLASCEKEIKIKLPTSTANKLVVEGIIETGEPPYLLLTKSFGFFSNINLGTLQSSFVHDAKVTVNDGLQSIQLREYTIDIGSDFKFSFYTVDTANPASFMFLGREEATYKLRVESEGQVYEATTKIPAGKGLDSLWSVVPKETPKNNPNVVQLFVRYSDPDTFGNCVRYFTSRNGESFYPGLNSVYNDDIINGTSLNFSLPAGQEQGTSFSRDSSGFFYKGDTITVKWCAIDKTSYTFWSTYEYAVRSVGNPFASPINLKSNVSNGALGIWAGYNPKYYKYIVPQ